MLKSSRRKIVISTLAGLAGITAAITKTQAQTQPPQNSDINNTQLPSESERSINTQTPQNNNITNNFIQQASDKIEIINTVNKIALMSDLRQWEQVTAQFTRKVEFDYSSLLPCEAITVPAVLQVKEWKESFAKRFKTTQHILGSHTVMLDGDKASCISHFQAHHILLDPNKDQTWTLGGTYNHELTRMDNAWKVNKMKMTVNWEEGMRPF